MRIDPDSEENQAATRQHEREVFALQMQAKADSVITDNVLRMAIAAAHAHWTFEPESDYVVIKEWGETRMRYYPSQPYDIASCLDLAGVEDYLNDLIAIRAAEEAVLTEPEWLEYWQEAFAIIERDAGRRAKGWDFLRITARQRAQAFVRTLAARAAKL